MVSTMARLALDEAPVVSLPRRFLISMPVWGVLAGALLLADGDAVLRSRWSPATLAWVHACTLGVLGNAMFGSLLQFLPAAAGVRLRCIASGRWMHGLLNSGALLLVGGFWLGSTASMAAAGLLLSMAFALLLTMTLPGICCAAGQRLLRAGVGLSLVFGGLAALLGSLLVFCIRHGYPVALPAWVDVHASLGVLGWVVLLLASVGRVVMPMFQGTGVPSARWHATWLAMLGGMLPVAVILHLRPSNDVLPWVLATFGASFGLAVAWLQRRTAKARRGPLWWSWRIGAVAMLASAASLLVIRHRGMLAGVLALGAALPLMVIGMALEIVAFLGWIELHRRVGRGVQLPGVQRLMPARERGGVVGAQIAAGVMVVVAAWYPQAWSARLAGVWICVAWLAVAAVFWNTDRRVRQFLHDHETLRR